MYNSIKILTLVYILQACSFFDNCYAGWWTGTHTGALFFSREHISLLSLAMRALVWISRQRSRTQSQHMASLKQRMLPSVPSIQRPWINESSRTVPSKQHPQINDHSLTQSQHAACRKQQMLPNPSKHWSHRVRTESLHLSRRMSTNTRK